MNVYLRIIMKKKYYCEYCGDQYVPKRRGVQKFCSTSCRTLQWRKNNADKREQLLPVAPSNEPQISKAPEKETRKESISLAGVANAAIGNFTVDFVKKKLTSKADMPATKRDIQEVKALLKERYLLIKNINKDPRGRSAYYDMLTSEMVYR